MGFLDRLIGRAGAEGLNISRTTVKQRFDIKVPAAQADQVRVALERWVHSKGWASAVSSKADGDQVTLSIEHDDSMPGPPPKLHSEETAAELQKLIQDAVKPA